MRFGVSRLKARRQCYESGGDLGTGRAGRAQGVEKSCLEVRRKQAGVESLTAMTVDMFPFPVCADLSAVSARLRLL